MKDNYKRNDNHWGRWIEAWDAAPGVLVLRLNRAPMNQFHEPMWREFHATVEKIGRTPSVRAVVISSASDKVFTLGLDVSDEVDNLRTEEESSRRSYRIHQHVRDFQDAISSLEHIPQPTIASLSGYCVGLGLDLSSSTDIRLCSTSSTFSIAEINLSLSPDIGTIQRFPRLVGNQSLARELAMTGRTWGPAEAKSLGFVSKVVEGGRAECEQEAVKIATEIAGKSPVGMMGVKRLLNHARDHTVQDSLEYTAAWNMSMLQSEDVVRSMRGMLSRSKEKLQFPDWGEREVKARL